MSAPTTSQSGPVRILACVLCQKRKVKCSRTFPCTNCARLEVACVPATQPRPRRRRFAERELLDRIRNYERIMRKNDLSFEPLHPDLESHSKASAGVGDSEDDQLESTASDEKASWTNNDDTFSSQFREGLLKTWDSSIDHEDHILFGSRHFPVVLLPLHPLPAQVFKLWQIYLDNVDPLLKVTHAPSLQGRIIQAVNNPLDMDKELEALLFSIYCIAVTSLDSGECLSYLGSSKDELLLQFRFGCQQALMNAEFLHSDHLDCLVALYLYLLSLYATVHVKSLSCMLGIAMRTAQRLGIPQEAANSKCTVFEAEMRRRLWWSMMLFDSRVNDVAGASSSLQVPTWDCQVPMNVSDSELRPDMMEIPVPSSKASDCIFTVVRSAMGDRIRHFAFHLDAINPRLRKLSERSTNQQCKDVNGLEKMLEQGLLCACTEDHPIQCLTIWSTRAQLARHRIMELYWQKAREDDGSSNNWATEAHQAAVRQLQCDKKAMETQSTKRFHWFARHFFPLPAYMHILQGLKTSSLQAATASLAWDTLNENFCARFASETASTPLQLKAVCGAIMEAWKSMEPTRKRLGVSLVPELVLNAERRLSQEAAPNGRELSIPDSSSVGAMSTFIEEGFIPPQSVLNEPDLCDLGAMESFTPQNMAVSGSDLYDLLPPPNLPNLPS